MQRTICHIRRLEASRSPLFLYFNFAKQSFMSEHSLTAGSEVPSERFSSSFTDLDQNPVGHTPHAMGLYRPKLFELLMVVLLILATDIALLQRNAGYAGWSLWGAIVGAFLLLGIGVRSLVGLRSRWTWFLTGTIFISSIRLVWQGDWLIVIALLLQLILLAMALHGLKLRGLPFTAFLVGWLPSGFVALPEALYCLSGCTSDRVRRRYLEWGVPLLFGGIFAGIFLKANPDSFIRFWDLCSSYLESVSLWFHDVTFARVFVWSLVCLAGLGALLPKLMPEIVSSERYSPLSGQALAGFDGDRSDVVHYLTFRNTLGLLIGIFGIYLFLEFQSMWFREFPEGFYYSGYAHQGAAWLTMALGLTTIVLSIVFYHASPTPMHQVSRHVRRLRSLGIVWFCQNLLLAMCVYNRLFVYIGFNGMTRLRVLGLLGITCVMVGLVLVLVRVYRGWTFTDLVYRQFWTMATFLLAFLLLPTDTIVYRYNVRCIEMLNARPSVQIVAHRMSPSGYLELLPLVDASDEVVREGVRALLAEEMINIKNRVESTEPNWRSYQYIEGRLIERLESIRSEKLTTYLDSEIKRNQAKERFRGYAMQWY